MAERKIVVFYESSSDIDEEAFMEYVHKFFCENPEEPNVETCPLHCMTLQDVVE